jgi:hypothetical protein
LSTRDLENSVNARKSGDAPIVLILTVFDLAEYLKATKPRDRVYLLFSMCRQIHGRCKSPPSQHAGCEWIMALSTTARNEALPLI